MYGIKPEDNKAVRSFSGNLATLGNPDTIWNSAGLLAESGNPPATANSISATSNPIPAEFKSVINSSPPTELRFNTGLSDVPTSSIKGSKPLSATSPSFVPSFNKPFMPPLSKPQMTSPLNQLLPLGQMPSLSQVTASLSQLQHSSPSNQLSSNQASPKFSSPTQSLPPKDPGYFSESECSSNCSSEKEPVAASSPPKDTAEVLPNIDEDMSGVEALVTAHPANDISVFHAHALEFESLSIDDNDVASDQSWKAIKKPGMDHESKFNEASIVPCFFEGYQDMIDANTVQPKANIIQYSKLQICVFCRNNGEDKSVYTTHTLMSTAGKVICPILYAYKCPICQATGDYAHTLKYCPMMPKGIGPNIPSSTRGVGKHRPKPMSSPKFASPKPFPAHLMDKVVTSPPINVSNLKKFGENNISNLANNFSCFSNKVGKTGSQLGGNFNTFGNNGNSFSNTPGIIGNINKVLGNGPTTPSTTLATPLGAFNSLAELQEAAQKILQFTTMLQGQQQVPNNQQQNQQQSINQFVFQLQSSLNQGKTSPTSSGPQVGGNMGTKHFINNSVRQGNSNFLNQASTQDTSPTAEQFIDLLKAQQEQPANSSPPTAQSASEEIFKMLGITKLSQEVISHGQSSSQMSSPNWEGAEVQTNNKENNSVSQLMANAVAKEQYNNMVAKEAYNNMIGHFTNG